MKLLVCLSQHHWTGAAEPTLTTAAMLAAQGDEVWVAFDRSRPGTLETKISELGLKATPELSLSRKPLRPLRMLADARSLARFVRNQGIDVVWCQLSHDHWIAALARRLSRTRFRIVRTLHTSAQSRRRPVHARLFESTDGIFSVGTPQRQELLKSYPGLDPARIKLLGGGVDCQRFAPSVEPLLIDGLPAGAPAVGIVSRIKAGRGHQMLLEAFDSLGGRFPDARLLIVGRGEGREELEQTARGLGCADRVLFLGFVDQDLPALLRRLDVLVLLGEGSDGTCRAVLEAAAGGVPTIATRVGAVPDQVENGRSGWLIDCGDRTQLEGALSEALDNLEQTRERGAQARKLVLDKFTIEARRDRARSGLEEVCALPILEHGTACAMSDLGLIGVLMYFVFAAVSISLAQIGLGLAVAAYVVRAVARRDPRPGGMRLLAPILAFILAAIIATLAAVDRERAIKGLLDNWVLFTPLIVATFLSVSHVRTALGLLFVGAVPIGVMGVIQHWVGWLSYPVKDNLKDLPELGITYHAMGFFSHHLTLGNVLAMVLAVALGLYFQRTRSDFEPLSFPFKIALGKVRRPWDSHIRQKLWLMLGSLPILLALFFTYARSAWVGLFCGALFLGYQRGRRALMTLLLVGVGVGLVLSLASPSLQRRVMSMGRTGVNLERILTWESTVRMIQDHPLTGVGPRNYRTSIPPYREDYNISFTSSAHAHNIYLQVPAEYGLLGLAAFVWLMVAIFRLGLGRVSGRLPPRPDAALHLGATAALVSFMAAGMFQHVFGDEEVMMLFAALAGTLVARGSQDNGDG
ncbi:MAG: glycosyltransferase [Candidatus Alcyoniella australis]|nr:glycosyltransferase [Candidatus Alcyoniella australis]